jgi:putative ribosome biogenesis GTPase RsgA
MRRLLYVTRVTLRFDSDHRASGSGAFEDIDELAAECKFRDGRITQERYGPSQTNAAAA